MSKPRIVQRYYIKKDNTVYTDLLEWERVLRVLLWSKLCSVGISISSCSNKDLLPVIPRTALVSPETNRPLETILLSPGLNVLSFKFGYCLCWCFYITQGIVHFGPSHRIKLYDCPVSWEYTFLFY